MEQFASKQKQFMEQVIGDTAGKPWYKVPLMVFIKNPNTQVHKRNIPVLNGSGGPQIYDAFR